MAGGDRGKHTGFHFAGGEGPEGCVGGGGFLVALQHGTTILLM